MLKDFLRSFFLVDLAKGLWVTLKYTPQPAFTFQYPSERRPVAPRFRGVLRLQVEPESGAQVCIVAPYYNQGLNLANPYHVQVFNEHSPRFWTAVQVFFGRMATL